MRTEEPLDWSGCAARDLLRDCLAFGSENWDCRPLCQKALQGLKNMGSGPLETLAELLRGQESLTVLLAGATEQIQRSFKSAVRAYLSGQKSCIEEQVLPEVHPSGLSGFVLAGACSGSRYLPNPSEASGRLIRMSKTLGGPFPRPEARAAFLRHVSDLLSKAGLTEQARQLAKQACQQDPRSEANWSCFLDRGMESGWTRENLVLGKARLTEILGSEPAHSNRMKRTLALLEDSGPEAKRHRSSPSRGKEPR